jgi:hypothetical protein
MTEILKSGGRAALVLRLGARLCVCLSRRALEPGVRKRIRPVIVGPFACWCDRSDGR